MGSADKSGNLFVQPPVLGLHGIEHFADRFVHLRLDATPCRLPASSPNWRDETATPAGWTDVWRARQTV